MKEKQERKKQDDMMKRGGGMAPPINKVQSDKVFLVEPTYNVDPKEVLQKKLETQDYNPFGKAGGGAPNLKPHQNITVNAEGNYSGLVMNNRIIFYQVEQQYPQRHPQMQPQVQPQTYIPQEYNHAQQMQSQKYNNQYQMMKNQSYRPPPQQVQQIQQYQRPSNQYPKQQYYQQHPPQKYQDYPHQVQTMKMPAQYQPQPIQRGYQQEPIRYVQPPHYQQVPYSLPSDPRAGQGERVRTLENQQMQEMYKRGGRNLLKLQNETVNEHLVKQKQKLQMQNFLKQQMQQAQHRKQLEKQKLKREEIEQQRRNRQYIQQQNQKLRDQQRKKNEQKQKIIQDNLKSLAKRKQLQQEAKDKLERQRLMQLQNQRKREEQGRQRERDRQREENSKMSKMSKQQDGRISREGERASREGRRMSREGTSSLGSVSSQNTTQGKGFNTEISKEFFRKQRQKQPEKFRNDKKLQMFTNQIQKMRDEINNQGEMFQKEIERIKKQSQLALIQKKKAEYQIEKLKLELQKKNREVELKLMQALKRNDPYSHPRQQYQDSLAQLERTEFRPQKKQYVPPTPPKMLKTNKIQQYEPQPLRQRPPQNPQKQSKKTLIDQYQPRRLDESQVMTLEADSKKIPLSIGGNSKLTMSNIEHYGKDSLYYQQSRVQPKNHYKQEPIMEEMEESRVKSRKSQRGMDQLDRFVDNRSNKRWEMSTVKDDFTKEIEDLLKKKENKPSGYNPIGQAGRQVLSRGGLPYQGNLNTLSSNKISAVSNGGTFDVDKVYDRNEARLKQLKALGVQTVNTNDGDDLNRLNDLLKRYQ